ncbi:hypothetical protein OIU78_022140 [Salix suchowensis]|nr:hypothetical protein OIU78_022140 [Salix suchowensis]
MVHVYVAKPVAISTGEDGYKEYVLTLDHSNFTETVTKHDFIVVEFYAPWCGHCQNLAPEYEKAASILSSSDHQIVLAKVNADENVNQEISEKFEKLTGPASAELKSADDATSFIGDNKVVIVGVFPQFSGEEFESFFCLRLFKPFDELFVDSKDFDVDALEKFIEESGAPIVTVFDDEPSNHPYIVKYFGSPLDKDSLFRKSPSTQFLSPLLSGSGDSADSIKTNYQEVAEQHKGDGLIFLLGDLEASQRALQYYGLKEDQAPLLFIETTGGKKYLKSNLESDHIAHWMKEYKEGRVPPFIKSEPIPEANEEPVKVVVADSLDDLVTKSGKNVLLEFYAPWCGHCQKLAPILEEIAVSYQSDADVLIAKLDATANDVPSDTYDVEGFPTVYLRSASGKLVQYEGDRTKQDIIDFIEKNRDEVAQQEPAKDEL